MQAVKLPYRILYAILIIGAILLAIPFFIPHKQADHIFAWSPGYWQLLPEIGLARIVPVSPARLVSPATGSGQKILRDQADNQPVSKY